MSQVPENGNRFIVTHGRAAAPHTRLPTVRRTSLTSAVIIINIIVAVVVVVVAAAVIIDVVIIIITTVVVVVVIIIIVVVVVVIKIIIVIIIIIVAVGGGGSVVIVVIIIIIIILDGTASPLEGDGLARVRGRLVGPGAAVGHGGEQLGGRALVEVVVQVVLHHVLKVVRMLDALRAPRRTTSGGECNPLFFGHAKAASEGECTKKREGDGRQNYKPPHQ
jgi:hypothetical protein